MDTRQQVDEDPGAHIDCGRVHASNELDHDTPLEQGGCNDQSNLVVRCTDCHKAKMKREAQERFKLY